MPTPTELPAQGPEAVDPLIGRTLANRYQIEVRLGEGAMGSVYRARHIKVGRPFAVKILHAKLLSDAKVALRFEREAELAGKLRHPNVIGVVDVGETEEGLRYMVMDFAEGKDLAGLLVEAPMPAARVMNLTRQLLEGLFHAHEQGLIHRDFKPENVIIERDAHGHEVPRIVDFGIAILREGGESSDSEGRLTTNGLVLGTPHYMAPEQAVADPIDHRIDLFALGIVIYEMLCGKLPFDGTGAEIARANLLLDPPMIEQRVPYLEVDPLLEAFARRLMAKRRESRPPTARAAREILDLIERDRAAAAAALGVPTEITRNRKPAITLDSMPRAPEPPPMVAAPMIVQAPTPAPLPVRENLETSITEPLDDGKSRKRLVLGLAAVVVGGVLAFIIITKAGGGHRDAPVTTAAIVIDAAPELVVPPQPPPPAPPVVVDAPIEEIGSAVAIIEPTPKHPKHVDPKPKPAELVKAPDVKTPPIATPSVSVSELVTIYTAVGRDIEALRSKKGDESISEIQPRYRLVNLNDAMATPAKRDAAFEVLAKLQHDIRGKLK